MFDILSEMCFPKHLFALLELSALQLTDMRQNGRHSSAFTVERGVEQGGIVSPHVFNVYTATVIREAGIEEIGIKIDL